MIGYYYSLNNYDICSYGTAKMLHSKNNIDVLTIKVCFGNVSQVTKYKLLVNG